MFDAIFLSTFPRRERHHTRWLRSQIWRSFLSTFPRRERPLVVWLSASLFYFYPRSHVGNDLNRIGLAFFNSSFLSTFPRRERRMRLIAGSCPRYFYPRSHVGNDRVPLAALWQRLHFYPRSHVGNDKLFSQLLTLDLISIHVPT